MGKIVSINGKRIADKEMQLTLRYWRWASEGMTRKLSQEQIEKLAQENMIQITVLEQKAAQMGLADFTKEERKTIQARAEYFWNQTVNRYKTQFLKQKKAFSELQAFQKAERFLKENGYCVRRLVENRKTEILYDRMIRLYLKKAEVSRADISLEMKRRVQEGMCMNMQLLEKVREDLKAEEAKRLLGRDLKDWIADSTVVRQA